MPIGIVKWVDQEKGAFIENMNESVALQDAALSENVFVPAEMLRNRPLKEGQMVRFELDDPAAKVAKSLELLE